MKKLKNIFTDYWVGTITGSFLIATAAHSIISTLALYFHQILTTEEPGSGPGFINYLLPTVYGGIVVILVGLVFLAIRRLKP